MTGCEKVLRDALENISEMITDSRATVTHGPLPRVQADAGQLTLVFQNLIMNALKFRGPEPPEVHISAKKSRAEWQFSVRDNGIGVDPAYAGKIFVIFQQLHGRKYPGMGIGLAVSKKIVERHGGRMWVEPGTGRGAVFCFTIPVRHQALTS